MALFRFSLQSVLDHRAHVESAKRQALLAAESVAAQEGAKLDSLEARLHELSRAFSDDFGALAAADVRGLLLEIEIVKTAVDGQRHLAGAARADASGARDEFMAARAERRQLEAVRDQQYAAFLAEQDRREAADHDEANARRGIISP
jgi:flagellar export protein FliJ